MKSAVSLSLRSDPQRASRIVGLIDHHAIAESYSTKGRTSRGGVCHYVTVLILARSTTATIACVVEHAQLRLSRNDGRASARPDVHGREAVGIDGVHRGALVRPRRRRADPGENGGPPAFAQNSGQPQLFIAVLPQGCIC